MTTLGTFKNSGHLEVEVRKVLQSGRITYGEKSKEFEDKFSSYHQCKHGIFVNSGTSALHASLMAMKELYGWDDYDEIIVPAITFVASVNAILWCRLTPVLVDVHLPSTLMDTGLITEALTDRTRAIMPVHVYGSVVDMNEVMGLAQKHGLKVIEDCCEAFGASWNSLMVGSIGDVGCFSTYAAHHLVTGVGGMITTNDTKLAQYCRSYVNHGIELNSLPKGSSYDPTHLARSFLFMRVGHSFRATELEAVMGLVQLEDADGMLEKRRANGNKMSEVFAQSDSLRPLHVYPEANHSYMVYPLMAYRACTNQVLAALRYHDIECRSLLPLTNQSCYISNGLTERWIEFKEDDYPNAKKVNEHGFYIGCHQGLSVDDCERLAYQVSEVVDSVEQVAVQGVSAITKMEKSSSGAKND